MSNGVVIFIVSTFLNVALSSETSTAVFRLSNKQGTYHITHSLLIKDNKVYVDEEQLSSTQVIALSEELQFLSRIEKSQKGKCIKGTYRFVLKRKNEEVEDGCAYSKRSIGILKAFEKLSKSIFLDEVKK